MIRKQLYLTQDDWFFDHQNSRFSFVESCCGDVATRYQYLFLFFVVLDFPQQLLWNNLIMINKRIDTYMTLQLKKVSPCVEVKTTNRLCMTKRQVHLAFAKVVKDITTMIPTYLFSDISLQHHRRMGRWGRDAAAPPQPPKKFRQLSFFGQQEEFGQSQVL